ncbi:MAG: DUF4254 domain-containing protein, partial [Candidatus Promineifilaceae bacterium]
RNITQRATLNSDRSDELLPRAALMADCFRDLVARWHRLAPPLVWPAVVELLPPACAHLGGRIERLGLINCFQWHLEDECRACYAQEAAVGQLKYEIDRSNGRRVRAIDEIDEAILPRLRPGLSELAGAPIALVTPGALVDRLAILALKEHHAAERGDGAARLAQLEEQTADLCLGMDALMAELVAGRQRLKFYGTLKFYGSQPDP